MNIQPGHSVTLRDLVEAGPSGAGSSKTSVALVRKKKAVRRLQFARGVADSESEEEDEEIIAGIITTEEVADVRVSKKKKVNDEIEEDGSEEDWEEEVAEETPVPVVDTEKVDVGNFVLVKFEAPGQDLYHYLARLERKISNSVFEVSFMRRKLDSKLFAFVFPENIEIKYIDATQILEVWNVKEIRRGNYIFPFNVEDTRIIR